MPNYGLVVTPTYNPMSFEEYAKPFQLYSEAYNKMADAYDQLELEAGQWEKLRDNAQDQEQWNIANKYLTDLRDAAEDLATNGLNLNTRGKVSNLRGRYSKEIKPIEEAFNYRQKMADEQRKLNPKGDMQWDVDFSTIGLSPLLKNPSMGYHGRSLSEMENEGFEQAKAASSRRIITQRAANMGGQYYQILQGYGKEAANTFLQQAMSENPSEYQELVNLYNQIRDSYGTTSENSPYSDEQNVLADERILDGMMKGLALQDSYQTNHWAMPSASRGRGSGDAEPEIEAIGYSKILNGREYTVTYEAGYPKYYDQVGNEYAPDFDDTHHNRYTFEDSQGNKHTIDFDNQSDKEKQLSDRRYGISPVNNSGTMVYVVDLWNRDSNGQPKKVTQNGQNVTYDRSKQYWNPVTKKVEDLPETEKKGTRLPILKEPIKVNSEGKVLKIKNKDNAAKGYTSMSYEDLSSELKIVVNNQIGGGGNKAYYNYYIDDDEVVIIPKRIVVTETQGSDFTENEIN